MPKSYRFRTEVGVDKEVRLNIDQDFDFLEVLSLKFRQEDLYDRFCADYGVVAGRVVVNGGFGVPNVNISIFVPLDNEDANDPIISTLYPYKKVIDKNEDGYRYNLLPYEQQYGGHTPTGTFPSRDDVLTRSEVLQVYEKYYKYTVKTNESGDFMIFGVPLGQQKIVMDLDLSNIGQFSLRPADLIRMGRGVETQFNGQQFKASEDLNSLPQLVNVIKEIEVYPFWGENDLCDVGLTRSDFDLRDEGIEIKPTSIFMGSLISTVKDQYLRANCKPKNKAGGLCNLETGPGQILAIRQTIDVDFSGKPILEEYKLEEGGNVIDDEGVWLIDLPMNLNYVTTNEFGEQIISIDPKNGIPTKGKYRFKIKYQNEGGLEEDVIRANFLVPNIKEHGWSGSTIDDLPSEEKRNKSYAFSLDWEDYYDSDSAINCNDSFYEFNYNKVYTVASNIDRFKWGFNRKKHLGIKQINDDSCKSLNNTPPVNDAVRSGSPFIFIFNFLLSIITVPLITLIIISHVLAFLYPILRIIINIIVAIINGIIYALCKAVAWIPGVNLDCQKSTLTPLPKENPFKTIALPMLSYPDCEACECSTKSTDNSSEQEQSAAETEANFAFGALIDATSTNAYVYDPDLNQSCVNDYGSGEVLDNSYLFRLSKRMLGSGYDNRDDKNGFYKEIIKENDTNVPNIDNKNDQFEWYKSPAYPIYKDVYDEKYKIRWAYQYNPTWAQALNLMNRRRMYFGDAGMNGLFNNMPGGPNYSSRKTTNRIQVSCVNDDFGPQNGAPWTDMCNVFLFDPGTDLTTGSLMTFNDLNQINDPNVNTYENGNQFGNQSITGNTNGNPNAYTQVEVPYVQANGQTGVGYANLINTSTTSYYTFKSGVEYFQVLTSMTLNEMSTQLKDFENDALLRKFVRTYRSKINCKQEASEEDGFISNLKVTESYDDYENIVVAFFVRGVDVYTPRQKMRYDLSKLFGFGINGQNDYVGARVVEGDYYMNIPIQPNGGGSGDEWWTNSESPTPHYEIDSPGSLKWYSSNNGGGGSDNWSDADKLYHTSYTFTPNGTDWQPFETYSFNKYCSLDGQISNAMPGYMGKFGVSLPDENFPDSGLNPWMQKRIEGCGYQYADYVGNGNDKKRRQLGSSAHRITSVSPLYLPKNYEQNGDGTYPNGVPHTLMSQPNKIVFRSDRLPSSDFFENFESDVEEFRRYTLHMNNIQKTYFISDDGVITTPEGEVIGAADSSGNSADDLEDANSTVANVISSFSCGGMVPLGCYEGDGEDFDIASPCYLSENEVWTGPERVVNGCYQFVIKRVIISIPRDILMLFEWRVRIRFMYALCQGIIGEMFQNNWLNGTLYMPAIQKQTLFNSDNEPTRYRYCGDPQQFWDNRKNQGPLYFNTDTNSFFYRSTPYDDESNQFVGQEPGRSYYTGQNKKNIWSPTTIMELGPRDEFTKEISFSPEFEGYFIDLVTSSSYKDISTIINLFAVSRLANAGFLETLLGAGDASVGAIFSREFDTIADGTAFADFITNPFDSRVDGDFAQMISINSEFGVIPYLDGNYEDSITVQDDRFGIWFSSNTQNRRLITNGVTTFGTEVEGPTNSFGYPNSQVIPFYMWRVKDNGLFGTEQNTWETSCIYASTYQGDDFFEGSGKYMKPNSGYGLGYIYNRSSSDPELDEFPLNSPNSCEDTSGGVISDLLSDGLARGNFKVGNPFHFYFGLRRGKTAMNRYIKKYIFNLE